MQRAQKGDRVTIHYIGTLDNGRIFDQRDADEPLSFVIGAGEIFPDMEAEITGMKVGEVKNIHLAAEQAYGLRLEENLLKVSRDMFPADRELRIGRKLNIELADNEQRMMRIRHVDEQEVLLDGNHDLAGCDLTFALELMEISDAI
jgi:FKBP-type peptidyl-prolyl cis-trans isomerase 2